MTAAVEFWSRLPSVRVTFVQSPGSETPCSRRSSQEFPPDWLRRWLTNSAAHNLDQAAEDFWGVLVEQRGSGPPTRCGACDRMTDQVPTTTGDDPGKRNKLGQFGPGNRANPHGRPKGVRHALAEFWAAIDADARKHGETIWEYALKQARVDNTVLKAVLERALPMAAIVRLEDGIVTSSPSELEQRRIYDSRRALHAEIEAARAAEVLTVDVAAVVVGTEETYSDESESEPQAPARPVKGNGKP